ncbi:porin [Vogesella mureinivorans]|jgi:predicted porin|uniref:porin n=1 Tax=Vogesella mureinivorans TaxID=657276 RepID=UPI00147884C9|nr:porin [Vogesella mureinivorans]
MKKLIVLATLAALPAAAMADVTISGNLAVGIVNTKETGKGSINTENRTNGEIKFAGSDDLGNGLKAVWQIANRINLADATDSNRGNQWAGRDSFVGLDGSFGRITMGNIYLMPNSGAMAIFENNSATFKSDLYDQGDRVNNTVSYKAPVIAGLSATVQHSFGSSSANEQAKQYADAVSLAYEIGGVSLSYDTVSEKLNAQGQKKKLHELNASVAVDALTLQAGYARGKDQSTDTKRNGWGLAASYAMGNVTPKLGYWREGDSKTGSATANDGHKAYAVGVEYGLSKRTRTGVEFAKANFDAAGKADVRTATVYLGTKF